MVFDDYRSYRDEKLIISVATTGGFHGKEANPNLPEQPAEIVDEICACRDAGASIVHVHARDEEGNHTKDPETFQEIQDGIQERCGDIVVNFTTGGSFTREELLRPVFETEPKPELATIDIGPVSLGQDLIGGNSRDKNEEFARRMREHGVKPELETFNPGHLTESQHLIEEGLVEPPYWFTLIFGMQTGTVPSPQNLMNFAANLPDEAEWQCLALGRDQLPLTTMATILGGHVRVGFEDNVYYQRGELAESNAQLVERTARIADELQRPVATPDEAREILGI
ncbi:3-keto-5-aminohexanoate cleavage protein [Halobium palmae]|uniref:3-keto-5-aminohexanoate cleavage protein n=1 Tax=Halobium palmae TaxID=1776492 RepID=A0ABD5RWQ5_9EURY